MRVTGVAQRDAWRSRTMPLTEQVRPDLWSIPVPIPGNPLRYTLSYLIAGDGGLVLVDPGMNTEPTWQALQAGLAEVGAAMSDLTGIVVTHVHPDHHGLSGRLRDASGAWIAMHPVERDSLPARIWDEARGPASDRDWLRRCGVPADIAAELAITPEGVRWVLAMVEPTMLLADGDLVPLPGRRLRAVWTPGHTPGHLCLHEETEDVLLTGDHVLPRITPNIGLQPHAADPPLAAYLASLKRTAGVRQRRGAARARVPVPRPGRPGPDAAGPSRPAVRRGAGHHRPARASHRLAAHPGTVLVPGLGRGDRDDAPGGPGGNRRAPGVPVRHRPGGRDGGRPRPGPLPRPPG